MASIKIRREQLPDHVGDTLNVLSNDGQKIGTLRFATKSGTTTSVLEYAPHPWEASREQQIDIAEQVLASSGWKAWPGCARRMGLL